MSFQDEYEDENEEEDEIDYGQLAREMNSVTEWLNNIPVDTETFMRCGAMAMCHGRLCADIEEEQEVTEGERDRFLEWMLRLSKDLFVLRKIMAQESIAKFDGGNYRPSIRKPTAMELDAINTADDDDDEEETDDTLI
jgi:hypothetical protein